MSANSFLDTPITSARDLLVRYAESANVQQLQALLTASNAARVRLDGLVGDQVCWVVAGLFRRLEKTTLLIATDSEEAAYWFTSLRNMLGPEAVNFFPSAFKRPAFFDRLDPEFILMRTEAINTLGTPGQAPLLIISYPEALFEQVLQPESLSEHRFDIQVGEKLDIDFLTEFLVMYDFERVEDVYEPGQFAIRGGIVDVFSFGHERPFRIELFDDEVESMRAFDAVTQLSIEKLTHIRILPNVQARATKKDKIPFPDILPDDAVVLMRDFQALQDKLQICFERLEAQAPSLSQHELPQLAAMLREGGFARPAAVVEALAAHPLALIGQQQSAHNPTTHIQFRGKPQPAFNRNFQMFIANLHENVANNLQNFLFTDNVKQIDRMQAIFQDLQAKVDWTPIRCDLHQGFIDEDLKVACYTDHQIFERYHPSKIKKGFSGDQAMTLSALRNLVPGDFVTHIDHGIGRFSGLEKIEIGGQTQEAVRLVYKNNDLLYVSIQSMHKISRYRGPEGQVPQLSKLGSDSWANLKRQTKNKVKDIAAGLIKLYAARKASTGHAFPPDGYLQHELEASFMYADTPDQYKSTQDVKADMEKAFPMDRLVCGDVGFGKTEVAIRAAFKAVCNGKQVAILCPTTFLARQHQQTFSKRLKEFDVVVDQISRLRTAKDRTRVLKDVAEGKIDILIGTHALLTKDLVFKDLGLLVIDEEQKFGVAAKEKLRAMKVNVDTLTLTATPIPRTLQFSLMAARDLSVMRTPPPDRQPIQTEVRVFNEELIREVIDLELARNGQVFFVHNRVNMLTDVAEMLRRSCPQARIATAHGQMKAETMDEVLSGFVDGEYDVLVCTNIIETGLDIPNANTIIINNAHHFGMSDLHQLRGRVGRSGRKAYCYLLAPPLSTLPTDTRKRLRTLEEFTDLGSGFYISMRDLDIRGAGNLLGGEQSGFIADVGFETYQKILEETLHELKETDFKDLFRDEMTRDKSFVRDTAIETDVEMHIPDAYIPQSDRRLALYRQLDELKDEEEIIAFEAMLNDRYGRVPLQLKALFDGLRLRWVGRRMGLERISLKGQKMVGVFVTNAQSAFYETAQFQAVNRFVDDLRKATSKHKKPIWAIEHTGKSLLLICREVNSLQQAREQLEWLEQQANGK